MATTPSPQPLDSSALSWLSEKMDASVAATLRLCQQQPHLKHVRKALLELEKEVHVKEKWDAPLRLFYLEEHVRTRRVTVVPQPRLSDLIRSISHRTHHRPSEVLDMLADVTEAARRQVDGIEPFPEPSGGPERQLLDALCNRMLSRIVPGGDLLPGRPGHRIHGVGLLSESWHTMPDDETSSAEITDLAKQHKVYTHPKRLETREIHYSARDGFAWEVIRFRRTPEVALPRYCWAHTHEDTARFEGAVPEALSRMCNAMVSDPVPIRHYPTDSDGIT